MRMIRAWLFRLGNILNKRSAERDLTTELESHLQLHIDDNLRTGMSPDEARRQAVIKLGGLDQTKEAVRDRRGLPWLDSLLQDTRFAIRMVRKYPGFTTVAVLTLALGIGANTAIFSAVDEILFRPPDVAAPGRLAQLYSFNRKSHTYRSSSYPEYLDFRDEARSFQNLAAYVRVSANVFFNRPVPEWTSVEFVSGNFFATLGVPPIVGRAFGPSDDVPGAAPVAMISEDTWRSRFAADPGAIGKTISISGQPVVIVGVVSHRVAGLNLNWGTPPRIWIPLHASTTAYPVFGKLFDRRSAIWLVLLGRLNVGASFESAQAELQTIAARAPGSNGTLSAVVFPLARSKFWPSYRSQIQTSLAGFAIATGLILLLACANVASLLLARALVRRREFGVRLAIGASSGRILRQLLTEGAVLGSLSCAAGVATAAGLMRLVALFPDALGLPLNLDLRIDSRALRFCVALSIFTVALFALAPALEAARLAIIPSLRGADPRSGARNQWFLGALVALQAAFCMTLLVGGGLYLRTLWKAYDTNLGFRTDHLLTAAFSLTPSAKGGADQMWRAQQAFLQRLAFTPGVVSASISGSVILNPARPTANVMWAGSPTDDVTVTYENVSRGFFRTIGIPLLEGQDFSASGANSSDVAIVDETLNQRLAGRGSLLGQTISVRVTGQQSDHQFRVVGIAGNAKLGSVWERPEGRIYVPGGAGDLYVGYLHMRTSVPPADLAPTISKFWNEVMPLAPLYEIETGRERLDAQLAPQRVAAALLGGFAILALVITAVGLYGVVAFSVGQRQHEIGIRMAIGAQPRAIFTTVVARAMVPALAGLITGVALSLPIMRIIAAKATNVSPHDVATYLGVAVVLAVAACLAAIIPARRAMRVDPMVVLRHE